MRSPSDPPAYLHTRWPLLGRFFRDPRMPLSVDEYEGVLVPLEQAHLYSHTARTGRTEYESLEQEEADVEAAGAEGSTGRPSNEGRNKDVSAADDDDVEEAAGMLPMQACEYSIEGLRRAVRKDSQGRPSDYELRSKLINKAIQDIGMGRYNWQLFLLCGFGWFADNLWMQGISLLLPSLSAEFDVPEKRVRYTTSALFLGLCFGSVLWGIGSDIMGRRIAFNCTLLITSVFGTLAAFAGSWPAVCILVAALGFGVGGNLPVDGALFLEFLPDASSHLLTLLSVWWPVGQLFSSLLAWWQIGGATDTHGWRKFVTTIGLVTFAMFCMRFFFFRMFESPKYLLSQGRQPEAVAVIHGLAYRNRTKTWLTEEILNTVAAEDDGDDGDGNVVSSGNEGTAPEGRSSFVGYHSTEGDDYDSDRDDTPLNDRRSASGAAQPTSLDGAKHHQQPKRSTTAGLIRDRLKAFSGERVRPLFQSKQLGMATVLIWFVWATIGMGYPLFNAFLPQYLARGENNSAGNGGAGAAVATAIRAAAEAATTEGGGSGGGGSATPTSVTYRNYAITSMMGVPGSLLAAYTVDSPSPLLGRRGTLAISTLVSAVFLVLFVLFGHSPGSMLAFSCIEAFAQNIMYGVLYAFTPEIFPAPVRGAGTGVSSFLNRITGLLAPVLAANLPGDGATGPIYLSAALILSAFFGMVLIPIETRGRQRL